MRLEVPHVTRHPELHCAYIPLGHIELAWYQREMWKHLKWLMSLGAILGGALLWFSSNSIPDFIQNANGHLGTNLSWLGWSHVPPALATSAADHVGQIIGAVLLTLAALCIFSVLIEYAWKRLRSGSSPNTLGKSFDRRIDLQCERPSPVIALPERSYMVIAPFAGVWGGRMSHPAEKPVPTADEASLGLVCIITNYASDPILDVELTMTATVTHQNNTDQVIGKIRVNKVNAGADQSVRFYIQNPGPPIIEIGFAETVNFTTLSGNMYNNIRLAKRANDERQSYFALSPMLKKTG